jgi:hypothetical protein
VRYREWAGGRAADALFDAVHGIFFFAIHLRGRQIIGAAGGKSNVRSTMSQSLTVLGPVLTANWALYPWRASGAIATVSNKLRSKDDRN